MLIDILVGWLKKEEGFRGRPYVDTKGKTTVGYGRNLDACPITPEEAEYLLRSSLSSLLLDCSRFIPGWGELDLLRQAVLADMAYNLGIAGLLKFQKMLAAIRSKDWKTAADEGRNSQWATQVGARATRLMNLLESGSL